MAPHQYIERETLDIRDEELYWDRLIGFLYSQVREHAPSLFRILTSARVSRLLSFLTYDSFLGRRLSGNQDFVRKSGIDFGECIEKPAYYTNARRIFERQIRYWELRPMPMQEKAVISPADSRVLIGSLTETAELFIKGKFFGFEELLGSEKTRWLDIFRGGDVAVFRLTPEKYHYNHTPVAGQVVDFYEISGAYHSCNPTAVIASVTPYSTNKRVVTIFDTDVPGGTHVGYVAMIEVVALMIGEIVQCYSERKYENPQSVAVGMNLKKGVPKSLYRPGSSTDILIFQKNRIRFADDLIRNRLNGNVQSRLTVGFGAPLVETDIRVRSLIGEASR